MTRLGDRPSGRIRGCSQRAVQIVGVAGRLDHSVCAAALGQDSAHRVKTRSRREHQYWSLRGLRETSGFRTSKRL